ncbi:unnamed protein product [Arabis nemorensis]|uniref:Uncharacterized protein n=1 Tax=Arabis nemorensis TaxID=586526 RepID=A0A565B764_9BRAS|nr:unnamed protein product [Arabis nemorensis]
MTAMALELSVLGRSVIGTNTSKLKRYGQKSKLSGKIFSANSSGFDKNQRCGFGSETSRVFFESGMIPSVCEKKQGVSCEEPGVADRHYDSTRIWVIDKPAAIQCSRRKRLYEQQVEQLGNFQLCIHDQMIMLDALRSGFCNESNPESNTMDEIIEQTENMKQIPRPIINSNWFSD